jgi:putative tryptophan/tyrosine transport system substrate-binding protein
LLVSPEAELGASARLIGELAEKHRLPAIYPTRNYIERGSGLMAYAADPVELARQVVDRVKRVLAGTKAGDIPIYQATRFELIINIRAARAIGLTMPQSLLAQADEVIE